jgi:excinuclease ABC subunit C
MMLESLLDEVAGLGQVRSKALLENFGSVTALRKASFAELAAVPGIGEKMANTIMATLAESFASERIDMQTGEILDA